MVDSELVILWGINASYTHINLMTLVKRRAAAGRFRGGIDPYRTQTAKRADRHLMPRPGTDTALALGMMHVLCAEGLIDQAISGGPRWASPRCATTCASTIPGE